MNLEVGTSQTSGPSTVAIVAFPHPCPLNQGSSTPQCQSTAPWPLGRNRIRPKAGGLLCATLAPTGHVLPSHWTVHAQFALQLHAPSSPRSWGELYMHGPVTPMRVSSSRGNCTCAFSRSVGIFFPTVPGSTV